MSKKALSFIIVVAGLLILFQNCSGDVGFETRDLGGELDSAQLGTDNNSQNDNDQDSGGSNNVVCDPLNNRGGGLFN